MAKATTGTKTTFDPTKDGVDHINIFSKGATALGRWMTNFADSPFLHPEDDRFQSVEGYWYWLKTADHVPRREELRWRVGFQAKKLGKELGEGGLMSIDPAFRLKIAKALRAKTQTYPLWADALKNSTLPLAHYYVYHGKVTELPQYEWITDIWEQIRKDLQNGNPVL